MELIKQFGIDPILLSAQILNFLIVLFLLKKFLYKPILDLLKKRQDVIKDGLRKADEAQNRLAKTMEQEKTILKNAQTQAQKIMEQAKEEIKNLSKKMEEGMKAISDKILSDARGQIQKETQEAEKKLTLSVGHVAIKLLEKALPSLLSGKDQEAILQRAIRKIKSS